MSDPVGFIVICTDRGRHKRIVFTNVTRGEDGRRHMSHASADRWGPPGDANDGGHSRDVYEFSCPRCGRAPQFRHDVWWTIVEKVFDAGMSQLDLSRMR